MPATDSPAVITLDAFISEAGLEPDAGSIEKGDLTIEKILEEKKVFDLSIRFEKFGTGNGNKGWSLPAPFTPTIVSTLPTSANLLHVSVDTTRTPTPNGPPSATQLLLATSADRRLHMLSTSPSFPLLDSLTHIQDSPILSCLAVDASHLQTITAGMSGQVVLYDHHTRQALDERRDHKKYVVKVTVWKPDPQAPPLLATAGWDGKVNLYRPTTDAAGDYAALGEPVASLTLPTNPETLLFVQDPATAVLYLLVTRRDSTSLHYYAVRTASSGPTTLSLAGTQNLAPHSNAWIAFSPSSIALCPTSSSLLAIATSSVPHMKLLLARLLFPTLSSSTPPTPSATQALQTRVMLATRDREEAAVVLHVNTLAPQTAWSTPMVAWRPDGSGVWVNGDDGVVRGVDALTGKVRVGLRGGHEEGSKVRSLWAGWVGEGEGREEWVVSGGFDKRLVVWKVGMGKGDGEEGRHGEVEVGG